MSLTTTLRALITVVESPASTRLDVGSALTAIADILDAEAGSIGDIKFLFTTTAPTGYIRLAGGTIGNGASGATLANESARGLFAYLWANLANAQAPVSSGRGASANADFDANKTLTIPDLRGKSPLGQSTSGVGSILGSPYGTLEHTHSVPAHYHGMGTGATLNITSSGSGTSGTFNGNHTHRIPTNQVGGGASAGVGRVANANNTVGTSDVNTFDNSGTSTDLNHSHSTPNHTHASGSVAGLIGLVTGGVNGNASMTSGTSTHAVIVGNYFIKYQ